ncbi:hypothetical protein pb186bvf_002434 [Paramecium bursaria]
MNQSSEEPHNQQQDAINEVVPWQQSQKKIQDYDLIDPWGGHNYSPRMPHPMSGQQQLPQFALHPERPDYDYDPSKVQIKGPTQPFRKHSFGEGFEGPEYHEGDMHKMQMMHYPYGYPPPQYRQMPMKGFSQYPMFPGWCRPQFQHHPGMYPFYGHPYPDQQQFQNTVSKELQQKVSQIVNGTGVSQFQCNCKKSKCLKLYCECFAQGQVCSQSCNCADCKNRIDNPNERSKAIEEALIRNPEAFQPVLAQKFGPAVYSEMVDQEHSKPIKEVAKDIKKSGCNCKKSGCKKKYCECYSGGRICNDLCKCENCQNKNDAQQQEKQGKQEQEEVENRESPEKEQNVFELNIKHKSKKIKKEDKNKQQQVQLEVKIYNNTKPSKSKKQDK